MIQINLLPWREQIRQVKKTRFITALATCIFIALFILIVFHVYYSSISSSQLSINTALSTAINDEQNALNQMSSEETERKNINEQLHFIIDLYNDNYTAVRLLNELTGLVSNSILVLQIKKTGREVALTGIAASEHDVTQLLDDIGKSPYFKQPTLASINVEKNTSEDARRFKLMFEQKGS